MIVRLVKIHMIDNDVGLGQNLVDLGLLDTVLPKKVLVDKGVVGDDALDKALGFTGGALADFAKTKDAEGLVFKTRHLGSRGVIPTVLLLNLTDVELEVLVERVHIGDGAFGDIPGAVFADGADAHAARSCLVHVYVVIAGGVDGDDLEVGSVLERFLVHLDEGCS